jgi:hypothetical protein
VRERVRDRKMTNVIFLVNESENDRKYEKVLKRSPEKRQRKDVERGSY